PSLVEKFSSRRYLDPSGSCRTVAVPVVVCSPSTNVPDASTTGSLVVCSAGGVAGSWATVGAALGLAVAGDCAGTEPAGADALTATAAGTASLTVLWVNSFHGWNRASPTAPPITRTTAAVTRMIFLRLRRGGATRRTSSSFIRSPTGGSMRMSGGDRRTRQAHRTG